MTLGERIKYYRREKGLTQRELAKELGLALGTIQQYELNKRTPKMKRIEDIAAVLDVNTVSLIQEPTEKVTLNEAELKMAELDMFEHSVAQLVFYDEFKLFQANLDKIKSDRIRNQTARYLKDVFELLNSYFSILSKEEKKGEKDLTRVYTDLKGNYVSEILLNLDNILNSIYQGIENDSLRKKNILNNY